MKIKAHAQAHGYPFCVHTLWYVPLIVEYEDGTTGVENVEFISYGDVQLIQKYFKLPTLQPLILEIPEK